MKKLIKKRSSIDKTILSVALIFALLPLSALITGVSLGIKSHPSVTLSDNPEQYWFRVKLEIYLILFILFRSKFTFPLLDSIFQSTIRFREKYKVLTNILFYLVTPIVIVFLLIFLLYIFDL
ncbi:hypothetical protein [Pseudoalteromonas sp. S558]|uniref:hypothetical protein n=1 Tax=Pseudoalteromonas sp. S558 TaxID=2066515 RepID=UPI00110A86A1|nr:hypothetical protein [Pseudoalteromonas sp. S558]